MQIVYAMFITFLVIALIASMVYISYNDEHWDSRVEEHEYPQLTSMEIENLQLKEENIRLREMAGYR